MEAWRRNVLLLWVAVFISAICWTMVMPFMPVFLEEQLGVLVGVSVWAGVLGAVNSGFNAVTAPIWGALGDRFGRKPMMLRAGLFLTIAYLAMSFVTNPYQLLGVRIMIGALTGFIPTATALVGTTTPQEHLGKALALVATATQSGSILGPLLGGVLSDLVGLRMTMVISSAMVAVATLVVLVAVKEQFTPTQKRVNIIGDMGEVLRNPVFLVLMVTPILMMGAQSAMEPVIVPHIRGLLGEGAPNWLAGAIYAVPGIAFVLAAPLWANLAERIGYKTTVALGFALGGALMLPQAVAVTGLGLGGLRLVAGFAMAAITPGISALITIVVPKEQRGRAFGLNQSAFAAGQMIGPVVGGLVGDNVGTAYVFPVSAVVLLIGAVWVWFVLGPMIKPARSTVA